MASGQPGAGVQATDVALDVGLLGGHFHHSATDATLMPPRKAFNSSSPIRSTVLSRRDVRRFERGRHLPAVTIREISM